MGVLFDGRGWWLFRNLFEGTYNDVPITAITRSIEIDLREMIDDKDIPEPIQSENGFLLSLKLKNATICR